MFSRLLQVLEPSGVTLERAYSTYTKKRSDGFTCHNHEVESSSACELTFASGPGVPATPGDGAWEGSHVIGGSVP